jgi:hypothetical protein
MRRNTNAEAELARHMRRAAVRSARDVLGADGSAICSRMYSMDVAVTAYPADRSERGVA